MTLSLSLNNGPPEVLLKNYMDLILGAFLLTMQTTVENVFHRGRERIDVCEISLALYRCVSPPHLTSSFNAWKSSASRERLQRMSRSMESGGTYWIPVPEKKRFNLLIRSKVTRAIGSVSTSWETQHKIAFRLLSQGKIILLRVCSFVAQEVLLCFVRYKLIVLDVSPKITLVTEYLSYSRSINRMLYRRFV